MNVIANSISVALGPIIGGLITTYASWEYNFFINIIFGSIGIILSICLLPKTPKFKESKVDWLGGLLIMIALIVLIIGLSYIAPENGNATLGWIATGVGIILLVLFIFYELNVPYAIIPK